MEKIFEEYPHRRYNPLTDAWVLVSPHRSKRPWQGQVEKLPPDDRPEYDPECYLCAGNTRANGEKNPDYKDVFVFNNDYSALIEDITDGISDSGFRISGAISKIQNPKSKLRGYSKIIFYFKPKRSAVSGVSCVFRQSII